NLYCPKPDGQYAGLYHNASAIGGAAVDAVVSMIHRNERGLPETPQTLLLEARWVEGNPAAEGAMNPSSFPCWRGEFPDPSLTRPQAAAPEFGGVSTLSAAPTACVRRRLFAR
ncbi:MAG TPA: hypothetical protein VGL72_07120, partial [Bryobacteraceae bacterium]